MPSSSTVPGLDERKAAILRAVVEEYIDTAQPVGSAHVASPRRLGLVGHRPQRDGRPRAGGLPPPAPHQRRPDPHREGLPLLRRPPGRRPTCRRLDAVQVRSFFDQAHGELEQMLADTTGLLGDLTNYAAVVVGPARRASRPLRAAGRPTAAGRPGRGRAVERRRREAHRRAASSDQRGRRGCGPAQRCRPRSGTGPLRARRGPLPAATPRPTAWSPRPYELMAGDDQATTPTTSSSAAPSQMASCLRRGRDRARGARHPRAAVVVVTLLRDVLDRGLHVAIGTETGMAPLAECALVVAPYAGRRASPPAPSACSARPA